MPYERDITEPSPTLESKTGSAWKIEPGSIRITEQDALILQSFDPDYPLQGSRTKRFEQVGNAVPPRLAMHVIAALIGEHG